MIFWAIDAVGIVICGGGFLRNEAVYHYRMKLNDIAYREGMADVNAGRYAESRRWNEALLAGPSYNEMMVRFWVPLRRFEFPEPLQGKLP